MFITIDLFVLLFLRQTGILRNFWFLSSMRMTHLALQNMSFMHFLYMHRHFWESSASKNQSRWRENNGTGIKLPLNLRLCVLSRQYSNSVHQWHCIVLQKITLIQIIRTTKGQQMRFHYTGSKCYASSRGIVYPRDIWVIKYSLIHFGNLGSSMTLRNTNQYNCHWY